ncbi:hypothetical protein [Prosthecobacter sp.]|uniref:hypothetical protein n=1 Tax=Prosthecobacter sp. TaxID=1965333 RepID=UPI003782DD6D
MKRSHAQSGLIKLYAAEKGIPLRTAQYHAQKQYPDYLAFVARMGSQALKADTPTQPQKQALLAVVQSGAADPGSVANRAAAESHIAPPAMSIPRERWTPEQYAECEAWIGLVEANAQRNAALARGEPMAALGFVNLAATMLKSYHLARAKRVASDIEAGRLKPMSAWQSTKGSISKVVALLAGLEGELAQTANPDNPLHARRAIAQWKERKWNPAIESLLSELTQGHGLAA